MTFGKRAVRSNCCFAAWERECALEVSGRAVPPDLGGTGCARALPAKRRMRDGINNRGMEVLSLLVFVNDHVFGLQGKVNTVHH